jgi:hypothetical protein
MTTWIITVVMQVQRMGWVPTAKGDSSDGDEQAQVRLLILLNEVDCAVPAQQCQ